MIHQQHIHDHFQHKNYHFSWTNIYIFIQPWRTAHELIPKKDVPTKFQLAWKYLQNIFWLGDLCGCKIFSGLGIFAVLGTPFWIVFLILQWIVRIIILKLIKHACNCLINGCLHYMMSSLVVFNISIYERKVFLFSSMLAKNGETALFANFNVQNPLFWCYSYMKCCFKVILSL